MFLQLRSGGALCLHPQYPYDDVSVFYVSRLPQGTRLCSVVGAYWYASRDCPECPYEPGKAPMYYVDLPKYYDDEYSGGRLFCCTQDVVYDMGYAYAVCPRIDCLKMPWAPNYSRFAKMISDLDDPRINCRVGYYGKDNCFYFYTTRPVEAGEELIMLDRGEGTRRSVAHIVP
jgi:hypothetical protein